MRGAVTKRIGMCLAVAMLAGCPPESNAVTDAASALDAASEVDAAAVPDARADPDAHVVADAFVGVDASILPDDAAVTSDAAFEMSDGGGLAFTTVYVIDDYQIPDAPTGPMMDTVPGFDLDAMVSIEGGAGDCEDAIGDYRSPTGELGVDNQLVGLLISTLMGFLSDLHFEDQVNAGISSGERVVAVRVGGIDSYRDDSSVTVDVFYVTAAGCALETCPLPRGVVADASWTERASPIAMGLPGTIVGGRLSVAMPSFPLVLDVSGTTWPIEVRDAVLRGRITPTALTEAAIGGAITVDDLVAFFESVMPGIGETARGLLVMYADLGPEPADPLTCESLSAGVGLTAVRGSLASP